MARKSSSAVSDSKRSRDSSNSSDNIFMKVCRSHSSNKQNLRVNVSSEVKDLEVQLRSALRKLFKDLSPNEEVTVEFELDVRSVPCSKIEELRKAKEILELQIKSQLSKPGEQLIRSVLLGPVQQTPGSPRRFKKGKKSDEN